MPMSTDAEHLGGPLNVSQCRTTSIGHLREHVCAQQLQTWTTNTSTGSYWRRCVRLRLWYGLVSLECFYLDFGQILENEIETSAWLDLIVAQIVGRFSSFQNLSSQHLLSSTFNRMKAGSSADKLFWSWARTFSTVFKWCSIPWWSTVKYVSQERFLKDGQSEKHMRSSLSTRFLHQVLFVCTHHHDIVRAMWMSLFPTKASRSAAIVLVASVISVRKSRCVVNMNSIALFSVALQDPTIDYSLQRLSKMIPKHTDDPDRLPKVKALSFLHRHIHIPSSHI